MHLLFDTLPKTPWYRKVEKNLFTRRRVGNFKNNRWCIKKYPGKPLCFRFKSRQRNQKLLHCKDLLTPTVLSWILSFRKFFLYYLDNLKVHLNRFVDLISKRNNTSDHQKNTTHKSDTRRYPGKWYKQNIKIKDFHYFLYFFLAYFEPLPL